MQSSASGPCHRCFSGHEGPGNAAPPCGLQGSPGRECSGPTPPPRPTHTRRVRGTRRGKRDRVSTHPSFKNPGPRSCVVQKQAGETFPLCEHVTSLVPALCRGLCRRRVNRHSTRVRPPFPPGTLCASSLLPCHGPRWLVCPYLGVRKSVLRGLRF